MFNKKQYKQEYYLKNKEKYSKDARERYFKNKEAINQTRKDKRMKETIEDRNKRLAFHKEYNNKTRDIQKVRVQLDDYKYKQYKSSALRRNYEFNLSLEEFIRIFHSQCTYCGKEDSRGIDRMDNKIGYTKSNSTSCCEMCNKMKWRYDKNKFLKQIIKIYDNNTKNI